MESYVKGNLFKVIQCPFCDSPHAEVTYEDNSIYRLNCYGCRNIILHQDCSWNAAVRFFERLLIVEEGRCV
jgi:hypothetical protein